MSSEMTQTSIRFATSEGSLYDDERKNRRTNSNNLNTKCTIRNLFYGKLVGYRYYHIRG